MDSSKTVYELLKELSDAQIQQLYRRVSVNDLIYLMKEDLSIREKLLPNVKMTTRLWLLSELEALGNVSKESLLNAEKAIFECLLDLKNNPPEEFDDY
jgi:flagellar motor switch protein FliG